MSTIILLICTLHFGGYQLALTYTTCGPPNGSQATCCERQCKERCGINTSCGNCSRNIQNISGQCDACWFDVCNKTLYNITSLNTTSHSEEGGDDKDKITVVVTFVVIVIATTLLVLLCKNKCRSPQATDRVVDDEEHTETENVVGDIDENFNQFFGESYSRGKYKIAQPEMNFAEVQENITCQTNSKPKKGNVTDDVSFRIPRESISDEVAAATVHRLFKKTLSQTDDDVAGDCNEPDIALGKADHKPEANNMKDTMNECSRHGDKNNEETNEICNNNTDENKKQVENKITQDKDGSTVDETENELYFQTEDERGMCRKKKRLSRHESRIDDQVC